jgi:hypothetical protein
VTAHLPGTEHITARWECAEAHDAEHRAIHAPGSAQDITGMFSSATLAVDHAADAQRDDALRMSHAFTVIAVRERARSIKER